MAIIVLYACTIFVSAYLLFQVQPLLGKTILPWFGGSASVWTTCMLFFQGTLLLGYLYAHLTTRHLSPKNQTMLHCSLLLLSVLTLPITPDPGWKPDGTEDPAILIIGLMAVSVGLPYFLLSTTGPLVQYWFAKEKSGRVPYRLFALSNFGSMLGLISYPLVFEPWLPTPRMSATWSIAYAGFALLCGAMALRGLRLRSTDTRPAEAVQRTLPTVRTMLKWGSLAGIPSILMIAITSHLTQNIAPIPLLWVLPLVIYLFTFVLCFESQGWYRRKWYLPAFFIASFAMLICLAFSFLVGYLFWSIALFSAGLFLSCMVCHGELERSKPHPTFLTSFYLMIASGGAAGGVFVALVAPRVFNDNYELTLTISLMLVLVGAIIWKGNANVVKRHRDLLLKISVACVTALSVLTIYPIVQQELGSLKTRNFYGTLSVYVRGDGDSRIKSLRHGIIIHGTQFVEPSKRNHPTTYYGRASGVGLAISTTRKDAPQRIGVVGLGVGTVAAYCRPMDYYRFYEINASVTNIAESEFTYLSSCEGEVEIVQGDARLSLERERSNQFDLLVLDAFSGDSVPAHLLTREAFAIYLRHLRDGGILAVHTSNGLLDLNPVVKVAADFYEKRFEVVHSPADPGNGVYPSEWALISSKPWPSVLLAGSGAKERTSVKSVRPWTDDYSSILGILK